jgi:hypothetical protein
VSKQEISRILPRRNVPSPPALIAQQGRSSRVQVIVLVQVYHRRPKPTQLPPLAPIPTLHTLLDYVTLTLVSLSTLLQDVLVSCRHTPSLAPNPAHPARRARILVQGYHDLYLHGLMALRLLGLDRSPFSVVSLVVEVPMPLDGRRRRNLSIWHP